MNDRCVMCGEIIQEGIMVCQQCEKFIANAYEICAGKIKASCDACPIGDRCASIDADQLGDIFGLLNRNNSLPKQARHWYQNRFMEKQ